MQLTEFLDPNTAHQRMRIAVISDIHGNLPALEAVSKDIQRRGADLVVNLGDSLSGPLLPRETAQFLMQTPWVHIAGNHERQLLTHAAHERSTSDAHAHAALTPKEFACLHRLAQPIGPVTKVSSVTAPPPVTCITCWKLYMPTA